MRNKITAVVFCGAMLLAGCELPTALTQTQTTQVDAETLEVQSAQIPEETQEQKEETKETIIQKVTVTAVGDCTLGATQTHGYAGSFHDYYDRYGEDYFFEGVRELFETDDFTLINLECVLSNSTDRVEKKWNLKGKPQYAGIMTASSVEGCSLGNNHTFDYGQSGLDETREMLNQAGIIFGFNEHVATYETESGIVIGIVSASQLSADEVHANYIRDGIKKLREEGADLVIASCHWGIEGDHYPNDYQQKLAHQIIDWGADVLIGTHPHVLQGVELYKGKVICYSLGNFCFGGNRNPNDKDTAVFRQTYTFVDGVLQSDISADMIPYSISSTTARNDFQPTMAQGERKQSILGKLNEYSLPYSEIGFDSNGKLMIREGEE
ncbi:MAG: CapA family protein [Lachnospiraceae bacterium]|nr:CapA family protein [Lachnospiraceae bacterium]